MTLTILKGHFISILTTHDQTISIKNQENNINIKNTDTRRIAIQTLSHIREYITFDIEQTYDMDVSLQSKTSSY